MNDEDFKTRSDSNPSRVLVAFSWESSLRLKQGVYCFGGRGIGEFGRETSTYIEH